MDRSVLCVDFKSFYASVECVDRSMDPFVTPLVVADRERGQGTIVLAVSPYLKELGIPSRLRVFDLPPIENLIFAKPRMSRYLEIQSKAISIFLSFVGADDLHIYSVDECFLDVTRYLKYHKADAYGIALKIKKRIYDELGLTVTIGIGPNLLLAKVSMDIESKHTKEQIAHWTYDDVKDKMWKIKPLSKMWGIGGRLEKRLNRLGIYSIGDLASFPKSLMMKYLGVIGGELIDHANGIDTSIINETYTPKSHALCVGQVLLKDYSLQEARLIIKEMNDDLLVRLRSEHYQCKTISLGIYYSKEIQGGFYHQYSFDSYTDDAKMIEEAFLSLFDTYSEDYPVRRIMLSATSLKKLHYFQPTLLESISEQDRRRNLYRTIDKIKRKYGENAILRASSCLPYSLIKEKHSKIGGHAK